MALKCEGCRLRGVCSSSRASWVFFLIGVVATVAMRVIEPLRSIDQSYGKISWYVGVIGFFLFFVYKYRVLREKSRIIRDSNLMGRLSSREGLSESDYPLLMELVCSQDNWKERTNFMVIFILSAVALVFALWLDLSS
ncbi:MAG: hypothetical protein ABIH11_03940 [Candidatus Altiarchaeota archaeon]